MINCTHYMTGRQAETDRSMRMLLLLHSCHKQQAGGQQLLLHDGWHITQLLVLDGAQQLQDCELKLCNDHPRSLQPQLLTTDGVNKTLAHA